MSVNSAILISLGICAVSAFLEGVCAGKNGKQFLTGLHLPSYSVPPWGWYIIGVFYYVVCFLILYRILRHESTTIRNVSLVLILVMMSINAFWNYIFFRAQDLFISFVVFIPYNAIAIALFVCLFLFDRVAAFSFLPYLLYLIYANLWGYGVWKLNPKRIIAPDPG